MKKRLFAVLAILGLVVGAAALAVPASAGNVFPPENTNQGNNS